MKVLCIDDKPKNIDGILYLNQKEKVIEFNSYTVISESLNKNGMPHYLLDGFSIPKCKWRFIPLSDLDETIIHQETLLQTS